MKDKLSAGSRDKRGWTGFLIYLIVWSAGILWFWLASAGDDAIAFSFLYLWIGLPVAAAIGSFLIGRCLLEKFWKIVSVLVFGMLYMFAEYLTFSLANTMSFQNINYPDGTLFLIGTGISAAGMLAGWAVSKVNNIK